MAKTASISLRIEPAASLMEGGFPFQPKQPRYNAETEAAIQETKDILAEKVKAKSYANVKEMIEDL
ncbi:MAG: hypothetical protein E6449_07965 [Veillonella sp.]|nr:hypothetical protein [Veillonella sp.]